MLNPFKLFTRMLVAGFKITGYALVCLFQILWYLWHRRTDKIGDAVGDCGRAVVDAIAEMFER